ncbi:MAG: hypothetical protein PHT51_02185 [Patescibacteria group bacterium]|nr:hypothetical protein [Patescibacteria group bacterium]MDD4611308.1 hypothetical protein [Patescibacteria group bacterium]
MIIKYLQSKYDEGFRFVVYTDDKLKNLQAFSEAAEKLKEKYGDFSYRLYHILNNNSGIKNKSNYFETGNLFAILKNEKKLI